MHFALFFLLLVCYLEFLYFDELSFFLKDNKYILFDRSNKSKYFHITFDKRVYMYINHMKCNQSINFTLKMQIYHN